MKDPRYSAAVIERCRNPGCAGRLPRGDPDVGTGEAGDPGGGDLIRIQVRIDPDERVAEARFKAFGCPATLACASFGAEWATGRPSSEAAALDAALVSKALDLGAEHRVQAALAARALAAAVADERLKRY